MSGKVYASSITESVKSSNSTSPLPQTTQVVKTTTKKQFLSRDVTTLYELFSNVPNNSKTNKSSSSPSTSLSEEVICYCCERRITKKRTDTTTIIKTEQEQDRKRKFQDITSSTTTNNNKVTSALYYGSTQVRKYMKKVMTRDSWADLLKNGFPCPHRVLWPNDIKDQSSSNCHHFCTLCDTNQTQDTLRLTLTPSSCRAQDNEIYGDYQSSSFTKNNRNTKKIKFF
ncbi:hypothetical protein BD770DRAFT_123052 [Pilaira anomala]|nr:hypothetical protein BD770DRAFT_123052 [Pilaira anomala]